MQLDITGWGFLLTLGLLAFAGWLVVVLRRHKRHLIPTVAVAVLLTAVLAADGVNSYFSDLPHIADVVSVVTGSNSWTQLHPADLQPAGSAAALHKAPHGGVIHLRVPDRGRGFGPSSALVYVPPQYFSEPTRRFPVVYLLHGSPGTPPDWIRGGGADDAGALLAELGRPALIVIPKMSHHWLDDPECVDGIHLRDETHLMADVLPTAEATFRTLPSAPDRVIAGMSAGGFCALNLGLRHPHTFGTIVDMSGLDHPTHTGGTAALFGPGPAGRAAAAANDPAIYAGHLPTDLPIRVWLDAGRSDREIVSEMYRLEGVLRSRGIEVRFTLRPGAHTYSVWRPALRQALPWAVPSTSGGPG